MKRSVKQVILFIALAVTLAASAWQYLQQTDSEIIELTVPPSTPVSVNNNESIEPLRQPHTQITNSTKVPDLSPAELPNHQTQLVMNLFKPHQWASPPREVTNIIEQRAPTPISIPVLPFIYLGKFEDKRGTVVYLTANNVLLTVAKDEVIDHVYRLDSISDSNLVLTYLPQNVQQTLYIKRNS